MIGLLEFETHINTHLACDNLKSLSHLVEIVQKWKQEYMKVKKQSTNSDL